ncbi:MAG: Crp/Fnr family transcriptional regulator [Anaerolineales bacterium]
MERLSSPLEKRMTALKHNRYLSSLDDKILQFLAQHTHLISYEAEENIVREGRGCQGLWIIESGRVKIYKNSSSGREMIINVFEAGESFNEVPVFDQLDNPVNAGAIIDSTIWLIDAQALRTVISDHPEAAQQIIINLSQNLRKLVGMVAELSFYTVTARLARLLSELPQDQLDGSGSQRLTQDDLAFRVGTVREVVARSLKELEKSGAIEVQRGKISIICQDKLIEWE